MKDIRISLDQSFEFWLIRTSKKLDVQANPPATRRWVSWQLGGTLCCTLSVACQSSSIFWYFPSDSTITFSLPCAGTRIPFSWQLPRYNSLPPTFPAWIRNSYQALICLCHFVDKLIGLRRRILLVPLALLFLSLETTGEAEQIAAESWVLRS